jgi:hypothetical protein
MSTAEQTTETTEPSTASTAVIHVTPDVLLPVSVDEARGAMRAYQEVVAAILEPTDWQGRPNYPGAFVKKSGFRKIAKAYGLSLELISEAVDRDDTGRVVRASYTYRAVAANGQHTDATGHCSVDEKRFAREEGRQKLENDLRATAETRAKNRAISDLVAFGQVSAEEVADSPETTGVELPAWAQDVTNERVSEVASELVDILTSMGLVDAADKVGAIGQAIFDHCDQGIPDAVAHAINLIHQHNTTETS